MKLPDGYRGRAPRLDEAAAVAAMMNEETEALIGRPLAAESWVGGPWTEPGAELERDFAVIDGPGGEIAGYLWLEWRPEEQLVFLVGCVALAHHGRGVGRAIVHEAERRARALDASVLRAGTLAAEPGVAALFSDLGYDEVRRFWSMTIDLRGDLPEAAAPAGIALRRLEPGQEELVHACIAEAFEDHWGGGELELSRWLHRVVEVNPRYEPALWVLAWAGGELAGALVGERSGETDGAGYVEALGVRSAYRRRGIGEALLREAFARFAAEGLTGAHLYVDSESLTGATRLYERAGMQAEPAFSHWQKRL